MAGPTITRLILDSAGTKPPPQGLRGDFFTENDISEKKKKVDL
jgi:hypothetical protein